MIASKTLKESHIEQHHLKKEEHAQWKLSYQEERSRPKEMMHNAKAAFTSLTILC
jgi:hypothetical protein